MSCAWRSEDGGKRFSAPVEIGAESVEGVQTSVGMLNLFAAPNGDLYASFLDGREWLAYWIANGKEPPKDQELSTQLRVARSTDAGQSREAWLTRAQYARSHGVLFGRNALLGERHSFANVQWVCAPASAVAWGLVTDSVCAIIKA